MQLAAIQPEATDRATFLGQTGTGKTTLARYLLGLRSDVPVLIFDWKGLIDWPGYRRFTSLQQLVGANKRRSIYAPGVSEFQSQDHWETFFRYAFQKGNCQVYVDEVYAVTSNDDLPDWYHACLSRGRERGVSVYSSTQRPMRIPQVILSESEHHYIFFLKMAQDRKKVESMTGLESDKIGELSKRYFYYTSDQGVTSGPHTLKIQRALTA